MSVNLSIKNVPDQPMMQVIFLLALELQGELVTLDAKMHRATKGN